jgi:hypothetical protein
MNRENRIIKPIHLYMHSDFQFQVINISYSNFHCFFCAKFSTLAGSNKNNTTA